MSRFRSSKGTTFIKKLRSRGDGYYRVSVPQHVVERENLKSGSTVRWKVEEIKDED